MKPQITKSIFIQLRATGSSFDKIAKELKTSKQTLIDWSKELQEEIANRKATELEALYGEYYLLKENRLQTFGTMLKKIKEEIDRRDLSDVPTDKLLDLLLKYQNGAKEEIVEPNYKSSQEITEDKEDREFLEILTAIPNHSTKLKAV